ncbi:peptidoglycan-binding protein [Streptomyces buecherae]|uniref:peptidoglycan-binding domain-containing protein n=1 Tax=Streptomyces buecherae TaxID=2763006 RepID=UPI00365161A0
MLSTNSSRRHVVPGPGGRGATVKALPYVLTRRGHELVADGDYGAVSVRAVRTFQSARKLVADGQVGPKTWPHLVDTLRQGHSGSRVRGLRTVPNKHSAGLAVDGGFGAVTRTAVRAFQAPTGWSSTASRARRPGRHSSADGGSGRRARREPLPGAAPPADRRGRPVSPLREAAPRDRPVKAGVSAVRARRALRGSGARGRGRRRGRPRSPG